MMTVVRLESVRYLDVHPVLPDDTTEEVATAFRSLRASLLLNIAVAANKLGGTDNSRIAVDATTRAIDRLQLSGSDKGSSWSAAPLKAQDRSFFDTLGKALFRRAVAYSVLQDDELAEADLVAAKAISNDEAITRELEKVKQKKKEKRDKEKKAFKGLFA